MAREEWKEVVGWPYEVSSLGRVRRTGKASGATAGQVLKQSPDRYGYIKVGLRRNAQKQMRFLVHVLVAEAFLPPRPDGHNVNHKNGKKGDPRASNLEWTTRSENQKHAFATSLQGRGEDHGMASLTEKQVREIRKRYADGYRGNQTAMAKEYGVTQSLISKIIRRDVWQHVD